MEEQHQTKWSRRIYVALITTLIITNIYVVIDSVRTSRSTRALNQQISETDKRWSNVIDRIQKRLDAQE